MSNTEETLTPQVIPPEYSAALNVPTVAHLVRPDLEYFASFPVQTDEDATTAATHREIAKQYIADVEAVFEKPKAAAYALHRWISGMESRILAPALVAIDNSRLATKGFLEHKERERMRVEAELRLFAQREANERWMQEQQRQQEEALPWELEKVRPEPPPPSVVLPVLAKAPPPAGVSTAKKPWSWRISSILSPRGALLALVQAAAADPTLLDALQFNDAYLKVKAKEMQAGLGDRFPGVEGYRDTRIK